MENTATTPDHTETRADYTGPGSIVLDHLTASDADVQEQLRRLHADFINFRRRTSSVAEQAAHKRSVEIITVLLPVIDNLERALATETSDPAYAEGVRLTYKQLMSELAGLGLEVIPALGEVFDPHVHEAVTTVAASEVPDGTVLEELRKGYRLSGTLLRPAQVAVATGSPVS